MAWDMLEHEPSEMGRFSEPLTGGELVGFQTELCVCCSGRGRLLGPVCGAGVIRAIIEPTAVAHLSYRGHIQHHVVSF